MTEVNTRRKSVLLPRAVFQQAPVLIISVLATTALAQDKPAVPPLIVSRVSGNVYMLRNDSQTFIGGNAAVLAGDDGLVLIDTQDGSHAQLLFDALKKISAKPVRYAVDTHCHTDHTGGNVALQKAGATVVAQDNVRRRLDAGKCGNGAFAPPSLTFDSELTLRLDDEEVRIVKLVTGHTDGDSIVYFKKANVVETGDVFTAPLPYYSKDSGGQLLGVVAQLKQLVALVPDDAKVIPGHGPQASMADVKRAIKVLDEITAAFSAEISKGRTLQDLRAEKFLSRWKDYIEEKDFDHYTRDFYEALEFAL